MKRRRNTIVIIWLVAGLTAALLVASYLLATSEERAFQNTLAANKYLIQARTVTRLLVNMETAERGYALSGKQSFLAPYTDALTQLPGLWSYLQQAAPSVGRPTKGAQSLASLVETLHSKADEWQHNVAEPEIELRRTGNVSMALEVAGSDQAKAYFDSFRDAAQDVEEHVNSDIAAHSSDAARVSAVRQWLVLSVGVLALATALFAVRVIRNENDLQEAAIRASEAERVRLQTILDNLPTAVRLAAPPDATIILQNKAAAELYPADQWNALGPGERAGRFPTTTPNGVPLPEDEWPIFRALQRGETVTNYEYVLTDAVKGPRSLLSSAAPLRNSQGRITSVVVVIQDVSRMKELERRKDEFIATAAHELRNPITALSGYYQLLRRFIKGTELPPQVERQLDGIGGQIGRLNSLVEHLLDASRIELGRLVLNKTSVDLGTVARTVASDVQTAGRTSHTILVSAPPDGPVVECDETRIAQVVTNFLSNAVRYSPANTQIELTVGEQDGHVRVEVADRGPGVPEEQRAALFERYYQVLPEGDEADEAPTSQGTPQRRGQGLGLGLYISSEIIKAHGGCIGMDPRPGGGSVFWFALPLEKESRPSTEA